MPLTKAKQAPPTFPFDVMAWLTDNHVRDMSAAARGAHIQLMCEAWYSSPVCTIPADDEKCASLARMTAIEWAGVRDSVLKAWPKHRSKWRRNKRLHATYREVIQRIAHKSATGRRAGLASAAKRKNDSNLREPEDPTHVGRPLNGRATTETETEYRNRNSNTRRISRGNPRANPPDSDSEFGGEGNGSDSGLGVREIDVGLVAIRRSLGIELPAVVAANRKDPSIRKQKTADWTDWQQNLEPAIRGALDDHELAWFEVTAKQCANTRKPPAVFRKRLSDAGINVGSLKSLVGSNA